MRLTFRRSGGLPPQARQALPGRGMFAMIWRVHCRRPATGVSVPTDRGKRGRDTKVSLPLLTPQPFLWTRLPSVARLNARGPQGRLVLQEYTLDRSGAFRSRTLPPCTGWPRTVMRGKPRKLTSGPESVPKSARRTEPSPRFPRFAAHLRCVSAKEGLGESRGGKGTIWGPCPLLSPPPDGGIPAGEHRLPRPPKAATVHAHFERKPRLQRRTAVSAEGIPSADGKRIFIYPSAEGCSE